MESNLKYPMTNKWINEMCNTYCTTAATWIKLEDIKLSEIARQER